MTDIAATGGSERNRQWRRFVATFVGVLAGGLLTIFIAVLVIDPYDTGRLPTFMPAGTDDTQQHGNTASRGRNPKFDAAIFGNSHGQLIDPVRLSRLTGLNFVQMTTPGSGPREQLILMRYFLRQHQTVRALVLTFDQTWCTHDPQLPALYTLPLWLFSESTLEYVSGMLSTRSIAAARRRVMLALGRSTSIDPAGYWDYETGRTWNFKPPDKDTRTAGDAAAPVQSDFPAIAALDVFLRELPDYPLVAIMPPQFYLMLPVANSSAARELALCKSELQRRIAARGGGFFDDLVESELSRNPANFMDYDHYRGNIARTIEDRIAGSLNRQKK